MATKKQITKIIDAEQDTTAAKKAKSSKKGATTSSIETAEPLAAEQPLKTTAPLAESTAAPAEAAAKVALRKVIFSLPKEAVENADTVAVWGDFNHWQNPIELKKQKDGSFQTSVELEAGRTYEYRFLINGEKWENDWHAEAYQPTPFGVHNSVVTA